MRISVHPHHGPPNTHHRNLPQPDPSLTDPTMAARRLTFQQAMVVAVGLAVTAALATAHPTTWAAQSRARRAAWQRVRTADGADGCCVGGDGTVLPTLRIEPVTSVNACKTACAAAADCAGFHSVGNDGNNKRECQMIGVCPGSPPCCS